jgi:lipopolysaccharide export system permease protein
MLKTLDRYILREVALPSLGGLLLLTLTLVVGRALKLIDLMVNRGVSPGEILDILGYIMPGFLELTFPMALLIGVLLGFGRMASDQEITAARSSGISLQRLAVPVLLVALAAFIVAAWLALVARPWANARLQDQLYQMTRAQAIAGIKEKVFNNNLPGLVVYTERIDPARSRLFGVVLSDDRDPHESSTVIAASGVLIPDLTHSSVVLRLFDGSVFGAAREENSSRITTFRTYDLTIRPPGSIASIRRDPDELSTGRLRRLIAAAQRERKPNLAAEAELWHRYTVPVATILFAIIAMTLGLKPVRGGQSERIGVCLVIFFSYYILMRWGQGLATAGKLNVVVAMSLPDIVFAGLAAWMFYRAANDLTNFGRGSLDVIWDLIERLGQRREVRA